MSAEDQSSVSHPTHNDKVHESGQVHHRSSSHPGSILASKDRTDFRPPRPSSRLAASSSRQTVSASTESRSDAVIGGSATVRWPHATQGYETKANLPDIFSPPRSKQSTPRATNASTRLEAMADNQHQDGVYPAEMEGVEVASDVFSIPVGSFNEDSPPRGRSMDSDERSRRKPSPRSSPGTRHAPMPLFHGDGDRDDRLNFSATFANVRSPSPTRRGNQSRYSYCPDHAAWQSPAPMDQTGRQLGDTPRRSPNALSASPDKRGADFFLQISTPSRPTRFPFEPSPRSGYDPLAFINTPKAGTSADDFSPVGYEQGMPFPMSDSGKIGYGTERNQEKPRETIPPDASPFSGFLSDFAPSPLGDAVGMTSPPFRSSQRAGGPYGRHHYMHMPPYYPPPPSHSNGATLSTLKASPLLPERDSRPRRLWSQDRQIPSSGATGSSGPGMRVEFGTGGKGGFDRINDMMHKEQTSAVSKHHHHRSSRYPYPPHFPPHPHYHISSHPGMPPPPHFHAPSRHTPVKADTQARGASSLLPFLSDSHLSVPKGKLSQRATTPEPVLKVGATTDKENQKQLPAKSNKRNPCNCKKSRCLKLYCECFSAEIYCDGCNCTDCQNNEHYKDIRDRAMKETRSKNPKAFKPRFIVEEDPAHSNHSMGCRCKKSECLKKYCECFQAGVFCGGKCKCKSCSNFAGSQQLIDKRRKMKDVRGAQIAMRAAEEAWKGPSSGRKAPIKVPSRTSSTPVSSRTESIPDSRGASPNHRIKSHLAPHSHSYIGPSYNYRMPPMSFSPLGVPPVTPAYSGPSSVFRAPPHSVVHPTSSQGLKRPAVKITPSIPPRTPAVRLNFDPASSRKKRKKGNQDESTHPYFGDRVPEQPKTVALAVFSFLSNEDVHKAALACKTWKSLAEDGELWQFP